MRYLPAIRRSPNRRASSSHLNIPASVLVPLKENPMRTRDLIRAGVALAALVAAPHHSSGSAPGEPDLGSNAALQYWQAFALLPPIDVDQAKRLENWQDLAHDPTFQKLVDDFGPSREFLLR